MRIVLDTNVLISGIFFNGPPSRILKAWRNQVFQIVLSKEILDEYQRVAENLSFKFPGVDILRIIDLITIHGQFVNTEDFDISICEDPDDDKFVECALAGNCNIIVSGDKHLLKLTEYREITVLNPRDFINRYL